MAALTKETLAVNWEPIAKKMRVVNLTLPLAIVVPALVVSALSKSTRGLTLYPGRPGLAIGVALLATSAALGYLLLGPAGVAGPVLSFWFVGTYGAATCAASLRPTAFVKPICARCRLLPIIKEHESIHLAGVASEKEVWGSMMTRHSVKSLGLDGDPNICSFCPIPKRLSGH